MKLLHGISALALVLLFSTLALADTFPGDPHMIPGVCTLGTVGCSSIPVPGNVFPVVSTGTTGSFSIFFANPANSGNTWTTLEIVIGAAFTDLTPSDYNFAALLATTPAGDCPFDATCSVAFGNPTVSVVGGQTILMYPALTGLFSVGPGQDLALFGALFPIGQNIPIAIAANGATPMSVPEPGTLALLLTGMVGVVARRRLRRHQPDHS